MRDSGLGAVELILIVLGVLAILWLVPKVL